MTPKLMLAVAVGAGAFLGVLAAALVIKQQVAASVQGSSVGTLASAVGNLLP